MSWVTPFGKVWTACLWSSAERECSARYSSSMVVKACCFLVNAKAVLAPTWRRNVEAADERQLRHRQEAGASASYSRDGIYGERRRRDIALYAAANHNTYRRLSLDDYLVTRIRGTT